MVEFRPAGLGVWFFGLVFGAFVPFSTICLFFPSFNDDLGTMPTRRPYSWKKNSTPPEMEPVMDCSLALTTLSGVTIKVSLSVAKFDQFEDLDDQVMD